MTARLVAAVILATVAISIAADRRPRYDAGAGTGRAGRAQEYLSGGFPWQLYELALPADNPQSAAKVALGKALFFDARLSSDNTISCANCHDPHKGFTDQQTTSDGVHMKLGERNAPTILDAMFNVEQFWDGREPTLEAQARDPILNPIEMGMPDRQTVVNKLNSIAEYQSQFKDVFGSAPDYDDMTKAIAAYERTQVAFDSPFDRYMAGDENALTAQQKRGWAIFNGQGRCMSCHGWNPTRPLFTDDRFHNIGVSAHKSDFVPLARQALGELTRGASALDIDRLAIQTDMSGLGRFLVTKQPHDIGAFRTMDLRNLYVTQPYFTTARRRLSGTRSIITTRAACRTRSSMAESFRWD